MGGRILIWGLFSFCVSQVVRLGARLTQVIRQVPQVRFDHSGVEVFVVSEELQVSGVVLKVGLGRSGDIRSENVSVSWKVLAGRAASTYF